MLHGPNFKTQSAAIVDANENGRYPSDHFPVTAELNWADNKVSQNNTPARHQKPHPQALANSHRAGDVDKPELVPFIVRDPQKLVGIVLDETAAQLTGSWQYSTHTPPYVGIGYLHDRKQNKGQSSVTWTPDLPETGTYEVRVSHCYNVRRATNTPIVVKHANGESTIRINQQEVPEHDRLFRSLGRFRFQAGRSGYVRINTHDTDNKYVIADAVQFIPLEI